MKKFFKLMIAISVLSSAFSACTKESEQDGLYNPKKKISEIVYQNKGVQYGQTYYTITKEIWTWNGNQLTSIDFGSGDGAYHYRTTMFRYDNKSRIEEMEIVGFRTYIFDYKDDVINVINCYDQIGDFIGKYEFKHKDNKISEIIIQGPDDNAKDALFNPLRFFLPDNTAEMVMNSTSKGTTHYKFSWSGNNVSKIEISDAANATATYKYKYDNKSNPFKSLYNLMDIAYAAICSANNATQIVYHMDDKDITVNYTYVYEDNYPVEKSRTYTQNLANITETTKYIYKD